MIPKAAHIPWQQPATSTHATHKPQGKLAEVSDTTRPRSKSATQPAHQGAKVVSSTNNSTTTAPSYMEIRKYVEHESTPFVDDNRRSEIHFSGITVQVTIFSPNFIQRSREVRFYKFIQREGLEAPPTNKLRFQAARHLETMEHLEPPGQH